MANKYIRHGETFNGDGTTSSAAASNGAAGAWNTLTYLEGTSPAYGSLAAGDTVYIRSKDPGGADITRTVSAAISLGYGSASVSSPTTWVLDQGTVWSGIAGTLTYNRTGGDHKTTFLAHNIFDATTADKWVWQDSYTNAYSYEVLVAQQGVSIRRWLFNFQVVTYTNNGPSGWIIGNYQNGSVTFNECTFKAGNKWFDTPFVVGAYVAAWFLDCKWNLATATYSVTLFRLGGNGAQLHVIGGEVDGAAATTGLTAFANSLDSGPITIHGTKIPSDVTLMAAPSGTGPCDVQLIGVGIDGGFGSVRYKISGQMDSRQDGYYPTLNATYPDSVSTPWSWKLYSTNATPAHPLDLTFSRVYSGTAATKTITVDFLVSTTFSAPNKGNTWVDISYVDDTTGKQKFISSLLTGSTAALDSSTASWSATTYGAVNLTKLKIALTTPTTIKQDTRVNISFRMSAKATSVNHLVFVDPDPQLS